VKQITVVYSKSVYEQYRDALPRRILLEQQFEDVSAVEQFSENTRHKWNRTLALHVQEERELKLIMRCISS
jgi:hypothetical protein